MCTAESKDMRHSGMQDKFAPRFGFCKSLANDIGIHRKRREGRKKEQSLFNTEEQGHRRVWQVMREILPQRRVRP